MAQSATMADYLSQLSKQTGSGQFFSGMSTQDVGSIAGTLLNTVNNYMMSLRNQAVNNKDINAATTFFKLYTALGGGGGGASAEQYIQNFKDNLNKQPRDYAEILDGARYDLVSLFSRNLDMAQRSLQGYGGNQEAAKDIIASMVNRAVPFLPEITAMANPEEKQILGKISPELVKGATAAGITTTAVANQPAAQAPTTKNVTQIPTSQTNYWKSPSGTIVGAPAGSEAENNFKNLGWTQSTSAEEVAGRQVQNISPTGEIQTTTGGQTTGQTITDPATGQVYQSAGANVGQPVSGQVGGATETPTAGEPDMTGWSQAQIDAYNASKDYVDNLAQQGKVVNPDIEINQDIINKFTEQAKTELSPYYTQIFNQANQDMQRASKQLAESYGSQERTLGEQYGKAIEGTQENYARRGLSDSTMRTGAEKELATQATRSLEDLQKNTENAAQDIGITGERTVGTANMPSLGSYNVGARPILGQAGVYGITPSSQSRSLYTPTGGTTGTYEQERLTAEEQRKKDLIASERDYRAQFYA